MAVATPLNTEAIRETFRAWNTERDSLDAELNDSLAALSAYQSHLDGWQQQLAREREELRAAREQLEHVRASADKSNSESSAAMVNELNAAREKITALTTLLLNRTEELRTLDNHRAEVQTELELAPARESDLKAALADTKRVADQEQSQWADELRQLRDVLERQLETPITEDAESASSAEAEQSAATQLPAHRPTTSDSARTIPQENPVFGSIVQQFGKLRQQRAVERQAHRQR